MSNNVKVILPKKIFEIGDLVLVDPLYIGDDLAAELYFSQNSLMEERSYADVHRSVQQWPWGIEIETSTTRNKTKCRISFNIGDVWVETENIRHMEKDT